MSINEVNSLKDFNKLRTAPILDKYKYLKFLNELSSYMKTADWFTVGIMAPSSIIAINTLREMESNLKWKTMKLNNKLNETGPVFLKANQKSGDFYIRIEHGLGEGILLSCQYDSDSSDAETFGPFPLDFFSHKVNV